MLFYFVIGLRPDQFHCTPEAFKFRNHCPRIDSYRFSMANLEDTQDVDLDAILGELCALESECEREIGHARDSKRLSGNY